MHRVRISNENEWWNLVAKLKIVKWLSRKFRIFAFSSELTSKQRFVASNAFSFVGRGSGRLYSTKFAIWNELWMNLARCMECVVVLQLSAICIVAYNEFEFVISIFCLWYLILHSLLTLSSHTAQLLATMRKRIIQKTYQRWPTNRQHWHNDWKMINFCTWQQWIASIAQISYIIQPEAVA